MRAFGDGVPATVGATRASTRLWRAAALAGGAVALAGCATVVRGAHETFRILSSPSGAHVQLSTGETCVTPCTLELPRAMTFQARVSLPGYATQVVRVSSRNNVGGAVGFIGNGVVGGIVGAGVDMDSGAMRSLSPNPLRVNLERLPAQK